MKILNINTKGFTLIETIIAMTLLAVLFTLLGGLMQGMMRLSIVAEEISGESREREFCLELIRKELGEALVKKNSENYQLNAGRDFLSYTTLREELLARDSISDGIKRVEWRFNPGNKQLIRSVANFSHTQTELLRPTETVFFDNLTNFELFQMTEMGWRQVTAVDTQLTDTEYILLKLTFGEHDAQIFESAFFIANENPG